MPAGERPLAGHARFPPRVLGPGPGRLDRRRPALRGVSWMPAGLRHEPRCRRPRRLPTAARGWCGPRDRCGLRPWHSAGQGPPGSGRAPGSRSWDGVFESLREIGLAKSLISRASSQAPPVASAAATARATTSRGASSPRGSASKAKRWPSRSSRMAPAPRTASVMSGAGFTPGSLRAVGMELEEFEVPQLGAYLPGQRPPVAGGHQRVGGDCDRAARRRRWRAPRRERRFRAPSPFGRAATPVTRRPS